MKIKNMRILDFKNFRKIIICFIIVLALFEFLGVKISFASSSPVLSPLNDYNEMYIDSVHAHEGPMITDADGDLFSYSWEFVSCPGPCPVLSNANGNLPVGREVFALSEIIPWLNFTPKDTGIHKLKLTITDKNGNTAVAFSDEKAVFPPTRVDIKLSAGAVNLEDNYLNVTAGTPVTITWTSSYADKCQTDGPWGFSSIPISRPINGSEILDASSIGLGASIPIRIECWNTTNGNQDYDEVSLRVSEPVIFVALKVNGYDVITNDSSLTQFKGMIFNLNGPVQPVNPIRYGIVPSISPKMIETFIYVEPYFLPAGDYTLSFSDPKESFMDYVKVYDPVSSTIKDLGKVKVTFDSINPKSQTLFSPIAPNNSAIIPNAHYPTAKFDINFKAVALPPDFSLNITPNSTIANPGQIKSYLIGTNFVNGFSGPVTLSVSSVTPVGKAANLARSFTKDGVTFSSTIDLAFSGDQAYLAVKDDQEADRDTNFNIVIRGKNGSLEHEYSQAFHINQKPVARFKAVTPTTGPAPLTVSFRDGDGNGASYDPDSLAPLIYTADLDTDGIIDKCYIPPIYISFLGNCDSIWPGSDAADPRTNDWTFVYNNTTASYAVIDFNLSEGFITLSGPAAIAITTGPSPLQPDLTASVPAPTTAITGDPQTYTSTISNVGADAAGPITHLFQYDNDSDHTSGVTTGTDTTGGILAGGVTAISDSHTFATSGTKYVRACADNDASFNGTVPESDETNNCSGSWTTVTVGAIPQCSNGLDDDGDTKIDFGADPSNDPGCSSLMDNDETDPPPQPECSDGIDNDGDGKIDFGAGPSNDPDCSSLIDNDEFNPNSGSCAPEHYSCLNGSSGNNENHTANWTWTCAGSDGIPVSCSERHKQPDWIED